MLEVERWAQFTLGVEWAFEAEQLADGAEI